MTPKTQLLKEIDAVPKASDGRRYFRRYPELHAKVAAYATEQMKDGKSMKAVCRELGIHDVLLRRWLKGVTSYTNDHGTTRADEDREAKRARWREKKRQERQARQKTGPDPAGVRAIIEQDRIVLEGLTLAQARDLISGRSR